MKPSISITLIIVIGIIVLGSIFGYVFLSKVNPSNTVTVNGEARINVLPDLVGIYFNVETLKDSSEDAKNKNAEIVEKVISNIMKEGINEKDIETINFNIYPEYTWTNNEQKLIGYKATHQLRVKLPTEKSDKIGKLIDAGVNGGALISYINFELSQEKQNEYKAEALKQASEDARIKAESIAQGFGKKIGKLLSVSTSNFDYYPWRVYENSAPSAGGVLAAKEAATNINPGEQEVYASVAAVFKIS